MPKLELSRRRIGIILNCLKESEDKLRVIAKYAALPLWQNHRSSLRAEEIRKIRFEIAKQRKERRDA